MFSQLTGSMQKRTKNDAIVSLLSDNTGLHPLFGAKKFSISLGKFDIGKSENDIGFSELALIFEIFKKIFLRSARNRQFCIGILFVV